VESRAQMSALPRNRPVRFYDLVVQVAIIRPGPIVGKMMNPYMKRRQGKEAVTYAHPLLEPVLRRTLGVPLFQEQLIRMSMIVANFSGGESEELHRAMGMRRSQARMRELEAKLRSGMTTNGIRSEAQEQIIQSIASFTLYGFPESHAASFALIAYASAYLKCHYLAAFTAAILNNQPMGFYNASTLVKDAQRHGLRVKPIDVQHSDWFCTLEPEDANGTTRSHLALFSARNIPIFAVVTAPSIGLAMREWLDRAGSLWPTQWMGKLAGNLEELETGLRTIAKTGNRRHWHLLPCFTVLVLAFLLNHPGRIKALRPEFDRKRFPVDSARVLLQLDRSRTIRLYSSWQWGGYLIYSTWPSISVFNDGRTDFYGPAFVEDGLRAWEVAPDWNNILARYGVNAALLPVDSALASVLRERRDWKPVYQDQVAVLFEKIEDMR
jgi:hypothetical protein